MGFQLLKEDKMLNYSISVMERLEQFLYSLKHLSYLMNHCIEISLLNWGKVHFRGVLLRKDLGFVMEFVEMHIS
jgi:hypothetical protein